MRFSAMLGALLSMASSGAISQSNQRTLDGMVAQLPAHHKASTPPRGKGVQAKPRKRPNMNHISRRTRRKHRRAAR
jgi:hypothetical protein